MSHAPTQTHRADIAVLSLVVVVVTVQLVCQFLSPLRNMIQSNWTNDSILVRDCEACDAANSLGCGSTRAAISYFICVYGDNFHLNRDEHARDVRRE